MTSHRFCCRSRIIAAAMVLGGVTSAEAQAQSIPASPLDPAATALRTPTAVAHFDARVHVRCSVPISGITYFAVSTSNNNRAARVLALLTTALAAGRDITIFYDPNDTSGTSIGCAASDCRLIQALEVF